MNNLALYFCAFSVTALFIYSLRGYAAKIGLVDRPCLRKQHCGEVPVIGGLAIFAAFIITFAVTFAISQNSFLQSPAFWIGGAILVTVGVLDDKFALSSQPRFVAQIIATAFMCLWGGVVLRDLGVLSLDGSLFTLGSLAVPFTVFAAVGVINALNMSDGIDGLSGSLSIVALLGLAIVTFVAGESQVFTAITVLMACVGAFLVFNLRFPTRPSALVFLGDAGSMFLGFALTWFVVSLAQGPDRIMTPVTALWFLAMPLFDTVGIMIRRMIKGRSPFQADREHFHHAFQLAGFSVFQTSLAITSCALVCMGIGLAGLYFQVSELLMFNAFLALFGLYFWGMMRAWKVMRFLRRAMKNEPTQLPTGLSSVNTEASIAETSKIVAFESNQVDQLRDIYLEEKKQADLPDAEFDIENAKLKLVVNKNPDDLPKVGSGNKSGTS